jgi:murein DD-endopeptidase MepM/ murein hydrolase activator NlpD
MRVLLPISETHVRRLPYAYGTLAVALLCGLVASIGASARLSHWLAAGEVERARATQVLSRVHGPPVDSTAFAELADSLARDVDRLVRIPSILPTVGLLSSRFDLHRQHPILHVTRAHDGIDIAAPFGAPVVAPAAGVVVKVGSLPGYGLLLEVDHGHGISTRYAHLSRVHVTEGQQVTVGLRLADVGSSGLSTGPHLHYEIHVGGRVVDPMAF